MAIDPTTTTTVKVGQLAAAAYNTTDLIPHEVSGNLKKGNIYDLALFIKEILNLEDAIGFRSVQITDGQTLPTTDKQEFILVGPGTYPNVGGGATITTTESLNALVSNGTFWYIGVEIPVSTLANWGDISGVISDQTDLWDILNLKADLVDGKVPSSQLPSYVDDVIEVANYAALPVTGETGKIYITIDTEYIYRWSGSAYIRIVDEAAAWGTITGTLSNQTDLQSALNAKVPTSRTITINGTTYDLSANRSWSITEGVWGQITGTLSNQTDLQSALDGKFDDPTGDTTQYIAGDGSLITFPVAGQAGTLVRSVLNNSGSTITKGTVVYINGASGNKPTIAKALATSDSTSAQTFGLVQADISNNANGYVVCIGDLIGVNTSGISVGTQLYLSSTTAGEYTTTKQLAPAHLVYVGVVTRSHASLGQIEVKIQNGYELDELHDVAISSKTNKDFLTYESSSDLWKNKSLGTIIGGTSSQFIKGNGSLDSNTYALDSVVVKLTGNQSISGKKSFNLVQTGYNLSLITSDIFSDGTIESNNGMLRLVNNTTSADLFRLESDGIVFAKAFKKDGGTSSEFLMADGSVSTGGGLSGTTNYIPKFTSSSSIGNSLIYDNGTAVGIGVVPETWGSATKALQLGLYASLYDSSGSTILGWNTYNNGTANKYIATGSLAMRYIINGSGHIWETAPTGTADANITYTERMRITSDGNVGIGNVPTIGRLFVKGIDGQPNNTITISTPDFVQSSDGSILTIGHNASSGSTTAILRNIILGGTTYGDIAFPFGNVGIGTPTPTAKLHVTGGSSANNTIFATTSVYANGSYGSLLRLGHVSTSGNTTAIIQNLTVGGTTEGNISFPQGNVGIGTTSPTNKLHIVGDSFTNSRLVLQRTSGAIGKYTLGVQNESGQFGIADESSGTSVDRFVIGPTGYVGIGTSSPTKRIHIYGTDDASSSMNFERPGVSTMTVGSNYISSSTTFRVFTSDTARIIVLENGNVGIGTVTPSYQLQLSTNSAAKPSTNTWTIASDSRIKTDVQPYTKGLNEILNIRPVTYKYNGLGGFNPEEGGIGIIAQEIKEVLPETVNSYMAKLNNDDDEETEIYNFDSHAITFVLINAIKELKAEIELLKNK